MPLHFGALVALFFLLKNAESALADGNQTNATALNLVTTTHGLSGNLSTLLEPQDLAVADKTHRFDQDAEARSVAGAVEGVELLRTKWQGVRMHPLTKFQRLGLREADIASGWSWSFFKWIIHTRKYELCLGPDKWICELLLFYEPAAHHPIENVLTALSKHGFGNRVKRIREDLQKPDSTIFKRLKQGWNNIGKPPLQVYRLAGVLNHQLIHITKHSVVLDVRYLHWLRFICRYNRSRENTDPYYFSPQKIQTILLPEDQNGLRDLLSVSMYAISIQVMKGDSKIKKFADELESYLYASLMAERKLTPLEFYDGLSFHWVVFKLDKSDPGFRALESYTLVYTKSNRPDMLKEATNVFAEGRSQDIKSFLQKVAKAREVS